MASDVVATILLNVRASGLAAFDEVKGGLAGIDAEAHSSALRSVGDNLSTVALAAGGLAAVLGGVSVKAAMDYEAATERWVTQAGMAQPAADKMRQSLLQLSQVTATGPEQLAASMYHVASAGIQGAQALNVVRAAAEGAKIGNADLEATTQAMIAATVSGISGIKSAQDAMAQLSATVGTGDMKMQDLALAMSTGILPAAKVAGLSFRDVSAALATITDNATPAEEVATRLRMTFSLMSAPTDKAQKALETIHVSANQMALDMRQPNGLLVALTDLKKHLEDTFGDSAAGKTSQNDVLARAFGGGKSSGAIETLLTQLDRLKAKYAEQAALAGQFAGEWEKTQKTTSYQLDQLKANFDTLGIEIGNALLPAVNNVLHAVTPVIGALDDFAQHHRSLVADLTIGAVAVGGLGAAYKILTATWTASAKVANAVSSAWAQIAGSAAEATAGTKAATPNWEAMNGVLVQLNVILPQVAERIGATGVAAGAATPELNAYAAALGDMEITASGLLVPMGATRAAMADVATVAPEAAVGITEATTATEGLALGVDALLAPEGIGLVLMAATLGVIAFQQVPAFRDAVNGAAGSLAPTAAKAQSLNDTLHQQVARYDALTTSMNNGTAVGLHSALAQSKLRSEIQQTTGAIAAQAAALGKIEYSKFGYNANQGPQMPGQANAEISVKLAGGTFGGDEQNLKKQVQLDQQALANALEFGVGSAKKFTQIGALDQGALLDHQQALIRAGAAIDVASGRVSAGTQKFVDNLNAQATGGINLLAIALSQHAPADKIKQLTDAAVGAQQGLKGFNADYKEASGIVSKAAGGLASSTGSVKSGLDKAAKAAVDFAATLSEAASKSFDKAVAAAFQGKGNQSALFGKAVAADRNETQFSDFGAKFKLKVDEAAGNWEATVSDTRTILQNAVDYWAGKALHDKGTPAEATDRAQLKEAEGHLKTFNGEVDKAKTKTKTLGDEFTRLSDAAGKHATKALDDYALGIKNHLPAFELDLLKRRAEAAAGGVDGFDKALNTAKHNIADQKPISPSDQLKKNESRHQQGLDDSEARITSAIEHHRTVTEGDIQAVQRHRVTTDADAQAHWDSSFAAASAAQKHQMLAAQASNLISHFTTLQSATQAVIDAQRAVAADESGIVKDRLDKMAKAYEDATVILQARNTGSKDAQAGVVTAINDNTGVLKAQSGVLGAILQAGLSGSQQSLATMAELIQVARDQLTVATEQAAADQAAAAWQQKIDADTVQSAIDTATLDQAQGQETISLAKDQLAIDKDKVKLAQDQLKLTELTNQGISLIASHFADVSAYNSQIKGADSQIGRDNSRINGAESLLGNDTRDWQTFIASLQQVVDGDNRKTATDQGSADASAGSGQATIATDNQKAQADQNYLSALQAVDQATQSVSSAFNQLSSDESKALVDGLDAMVTSVNDATSVFTSMAGVSKAGEDGQIKAVQDQSGIIKAEGDISHAQNSAQLAVANDELRIAEDTLQADQSAAQWNVRIAQDQVKIASDKAAADALKASWDQTIDLDVLKIDQDKVKLAEDQLLLTEQNLVLAAVIAGALTGTDPSQYASQLSPLLQQINSDQTQIATDQAQQQRDQQTAAQQEAQASLQSAYDAQQLARDQAAADSSSAAGQMRLAQDANRLAADQVAQQSQTNSLLGQSLSDMQTYFGNLNTAMRNLRSGVDYHWVGSGPNPFEAFMNYAPANFASNPTAG